MNTRLNEKPWHAIDLAELRYGFGSSVEEIADFLHRDIKDVTRLMLKCGEVEKGCTNSAALPRCRLRLRGAAVWQDYVLRLWLPPRCARPT
jgi:hypothetical protein